MTSHREREGGRVIKSESRFPRTLHEAATRADQEHRGASSLGPNWSKVSFRETENHFKPSNSAARVPFVPTQRAPPCLRLLHVKSLTRYELRQRHTYTRKVERHAPRETGERERQVGRRGRTRTQWQVISGDGSDITCNDAVSLNNVAFH